MRIYVCVCVTARHYTLCNKHFISCSTAPDPVMNFSVSELANGSLLLTWVPPLVSNGEYCYIISYTFMSLFNYTDYPDRTETSNDVINITLDREDNKLGLNKNSLLLENRSNETTRIRSYAKYIFTITGVNTRLKAESVPVQDSIDTQSQGEKMFVHTMRMCSTLSFLQPPSSLSLIYC